MRRLQKWLDVGKGERLGWLPGSNSVSMCRAVPTADRGMAWDRPLRGGFRVQSDMVAGHAAR